MALTTRTITRRALYTKSVQSSLEIGQHFSEIGACEIHQTVTFHDFECLFCYICDHPILILGQLVQDVKGVNHFSDVVFCYYSFV